MKYLKYILPLALLNPLLNADQILLNDSWTTGVRNVQNLPTRSAWYSTSTERLSTSVGAMTGVLEGSSRMWMTYFTNENPYAIADGETLRISLSFIPQNVNASNSSRGFRVGIFNYENGIRVPGDDMSSSGGNGAGVEGYLLNMNFGQAFGVNNPIEIRRRTAISTDNLMGAVGSYSEPLVSGGGALNDAAFSSGTLYHLDFEVTRNGEIAVVTVRISDGLGWSVETTAVDTEAAVLAFDSIAVRPANDTQTAASFVFKNAKVQVINDGVLPGDDIVIDTHAMTSLVAESDEEGGGWYYNETIGMFWNPGVELPYIYSADYERWYQLNRSTGGLYYFYDLERDEWWTTETEYQGNLWNYHQGYWYYHDGEDFVERSPVFEIDFDLSIPEAKNAYYIAPGGSNANPGTEAEPFATLNKAITVVTPGDIIWVKEGIYPVTQTVSIQSSGNAPDRIYLLAEEGAEVVFDYSAQPFGGNQRGIELPGSYWHIGGITVKGAGDNGFFVTGSHNILNQCVAHENRDSGFQLDNGSSYNLVINCDSYRNFDAPTAGENADGFAAKFDIGPGNYFYGCRAWENADDGWDLWRAPETVVIENCRAFRNGINVWDATPFTGNGNGFKLGGDLVAGEHIVRRNLAFDNVRRGFDQNNNTGGMVITHNTAFNNDPNYHFPNNPVTGTLVFRNNIHHRGGANITLGADLAGNTFRQVTLFDSHFASLDTSGATQPRGPDGSLPQSDMLRLSENSYAIDRGVDIGEPYNGSAPDMGAFEYAE